MSPSVRAASLSLLLTGSAIPASSAPIVFADPAHQFAWTPSLYQSSSLIHLGQGLDVAMGPAQPGAATTRTFLYAETSANILGGFFPDQMHHVRPLAGARLALDEAILAPLPAALLVLTPRLFQPGDLIGPAEHYVDQPVILTFDSVSFGIEILWAMERSVLGLQLTLPDGVHYGWLELEAVRTPGNAFQRYRARRWAWESAPNTPIAAPSACIADLDDDGVVSASDLSALLGSWGDPAAPADFNNDGIVNSSDLGRMLGLWGVCD